MRLVMLVIFLMAPAVKAQDRVPDFSDRSRFLNEKRMGPTPVAETTTELPGDMQTHDAVTAGKPLAAAGVQVQSLTPLSPESTQAPLQTKASEAASTNVASDVPFVSSLAHLSSMFSGVWDLTIEDERIDVALMRWTSSLGYGFRWDADRYFPIVAPTSFYGTYEESLTRLLMSPGILNSSYPLEACIYANDPPLVRITRMGDQTQECR